jgi:hypothetical protein
MSFDEEARLQDAIITSFNPIEFGKRRTSHWQTDHLERKPLDRHVPLLD